MAGPLDWSGPSFLGLYAAVIAGAGVASFIGRWLMTSLSRSDGPSRELSSTQLAYLAGGPGRALQAAIVSLTHRGRAKLTSGDILVALETGGKRSGDALEKMLLDLSSNRICRISTLRSDCRPALQRINDSLADEGLLLTQSQRWLLMAWNAALFGTLLVFGFAKASIALPRGKPIGFLFIEMVFALGLGLICMVVLPRVNRAGKEYLKQRKTAYESAGSETKWSVKRADRVAVNTIDPNVLPLGVALLGPAALIGTPWAADEVRLRQLTPVELTGSGSGFGDSGGTSSCGGGSSCGSSCGGGGGCGGCSS